jgi:hypothetical protein
VGCTSKRAATTLEINIFQIIIFSPYFSATIQ